MNSPKVYLSLDIGGQRIGVATGDSVARLASIQPTVQVNGREAEEIRRLVADLGVTDLVVGRPRNQAGETTNQTQTVEAFAAQALSPLALPIHWQDESLTSVIAEERLAARKKPYSKADIDAEAAAIILQDYLDTL
jgi:putative Holliday junction resolvase